MPVESGRALAQRPLVMGWLPYCSRRASEASSLSRICSKVAVSISPPAAALRRISIAEEPLVGGAAALVLLLSQRNAAQTSTTSRAIQSMPPSDMRNMLPQPNPYPHIIGVSSLSSSTQQACCLPVTRKVLCKHAFHLEVSLAPLTLLSHRWPAVSQSAHGMLRFLLFATAGSEHVQ